VRPGKSHSIFFQDLFIKIEKKMEDQKLFKNQDSKILIDIIVSIYKDNKSGINTLIESIDLLAQEVDTSQTAPTHTDSPTLIPFRLTQTKMPGMKAVTSTQPPASPESVDLKASWATVARRGGKKRNANQAGSNLQSPNL